MGNTTVHYGKSWFLSLLHVIGKVQCILFRWIWPCILPWRVWWLKIGSGVLSPGWCILHMLFVVREVSPTCFCVMILVDVRLVLSLWFLRDLSFFGWLVLLLLDTCLLYQSQEWHNSFSCLWGFLWLPVVLHGIGWGSEVGSFYHQYSYISPLPNTCWPCVLHCCCHCMDFCVWHYTHALVGGLGGLCLCARWVHHICRSSNTSIFSNILWHLKWLFLFKLLLLPCVKWRTELVWCVYVVGLLICLSATLSMA